MLFSSMILDNKQDPSLWIAHEPGSELIAIQHCWLGYVKNAQHPKSWAAAV